jgi:hypothetical protein
MKIQLVKEVNEKGETWYCVEKDGRYIPSTLTRKFDEAVETYNKVITADPTREVLMETEIDY